MLQMTSMYSFLLATAPSKRRPENQGKKLELTGRRIKGRAKANGEKRLSKSRLGTLEVTGVNSHAKINLHAPDGRTRHFNRQTRQRQTKTGSKTRQKGHFSADRAYNISNMFWPVEPERQDDSKMTDSGYCREKDTVHGQSRPVFDTPTGCWRN